MQDQPQVLNTGVRGWLSKRFPLIIVGYLASIIAASSMVTALIIVVSNAGYIFGSNNTHNSGVGIGAAVGVGFFSILFIVPTTAVQTIITVAISENRRIRSPLYYIMAGMLTGLTAWMMLFSSPVEPHLVGLSWFIILLIMFGSISGFVYWFIAARNAWKDDERTSSGYGIYVFYSYVAALYISILMSKIVITFIRLAYNVDSWRTYDATLFLLVLPITAVHATIMGILFTGVQFLIFAYASEKYGLKALWHHVAAGIAIALSIYFYNFMTSQPSPLNPPEGFAVMKVINFVVNVATGAIGGGVYWWLSWLRVGKNT